MRSSIIARLLCLSVVLAAVAWAGPAGYDFTFTTFYQFGNPGDLLGGGSASPDTGFVRITNNGPSTLTGTFSTLAVTSGGTDQSFSSAVNLTTGQTASIAIGAESSNVGGYNGPFGSPQPGVQILFSGAATLGALTQAVSVSAFDRDIHSGVSQTNPFGVTLDNYVLQGGDPIGRDTGDGFETAQAPGVVHFVDRATTATPEPGSIILAGSALLGLAVRRLVRK